jgi:short-subunit dehydrogenase
VDTVQKALNGKDLNCLINNAGVAAKLKFADINEKDMMETYRQNVIGPWKMTKVNPIDFCDMLRLMRLVR